MNMRTRFQESAEARSEPPAVSSGCQAAPLPPKIVFAAGKVNASQRALQSFCNGVQAFCNGFLCVLGFRFQEGNVE